MILNHTEILVQTLYLIASVLFILGLKDMSNATTARRGVIFAEIGMFSAVIGTLIYGIYVSKIIIDWKWILLGITVGSIIGTVMGLWIPMTKMPERIALSHAFGGLAVAIVGIVEYKEHYSLGMTTFKLLSTNSEIIFGTITFSGSLIAFGKLQGILGGNAITWPFSNLMNYSLIILSIILIIALTFFNVNYLLGISLFWIIVFLGTLIGITLVLPIGGPDMPVVICLLNSYAGLAAAATGFALNNNVLIICGALDGCSGFFLSMMMAKAMNRSFFNIVFGSMGLNSEKESTSESTSFSAPNVSSLEAATAVLKYAKSIIIIPGYGMAVSQAQYAVRDLTNILAAEGCDIKYAIHPVAGRMPGHMNVLLAEANVSYDQLYDLDMINDDFKNTDVALVVGANDIVNTAAKNNKNSPIYGMPILAADQAKVCIVLKRSLNPGFAGIENELFVKPNTMLVLGDAKSTISQFVSLLKEDE